MLAEESQTSDIVRLNENGVLPTLEIQKDLQILFSNQTSQVCVDSAVMTKIHLGEARVHTEERGK